MFCGYCGKENAEDYSFCTGCGKPFKSGTPNQPIQPEEESENLKASPQDTQETKSRKDSVPQSKYISVTWWKDCEWPWQARSLDGRTLLGSYETEVKAADVVAKFHGINRMDLMMAAVDSEKEEELRHKLRKRTIDEQWKTKATKNPEMSKPEGTMNGHTSSSAQPEIKEHFEAPAVSESVKTKTLHPDRKSRQTHTSICSICKGPLPEKLPHDMTVCSTNCYNKFWHKHYRSQLIAGSVFGALSAWAIGSLLGVVMIGIIVLVFANIKIDQMKNYPWR